MPRGGKRAGAGRKRGVPNTKTQELQQKIEASGLTPLDYMLSLLRDADLPREERFEAAKAAAPYVHARLASVEHSGTIATRNASEVTDDELANIAAGGSEGASEAQVNKAQLN
jgi:hypothetical protein